MRKLSREEAEKMTRAGGVVLHGGQEYRAERAKGQHGAAALPADKDGFEAMRNPDGTLTRAGMEHVIRNGGSVSHLGEIIESVGDLPPEDVLAAGNAERLKLAVDAHDEQIANLMAAKARSEKALREAEEAAKQRAAEPEPDKEPKHPAHAQHAQHAPKHKTKE